MNEIVREYKNDIREKASTARGIYGRKGKSGKGAPKFPSDYLSKKEKNELNGPVTTMDPHKFYTWEEFKQLTPRLQVEYIDGLVKRYHIGVSTVSTKVFGKSASALKEHFKKHGITYKGGYKGNPPKEGLKRLAKDMGGDRTYKPIFDENGDQEGIEIVGEEIKTPEKPYRPIYDEQEEIKMDILNTVETSVTGVEQFYPGAIEPAIESPVSFHDISFTMNGFDFEFLKLLADRFPEKVRVSISITTEE